MNTHERFAKIMEALANLEREREAQDATWKTLGPELARAGQTELWIESLPEVTTTAPAAPAFLAGVRA